MGSVAALPRKMTFSDLERRPDDGRRFELYDGEVWEMPSPMPEHQAAADNALVLLRAYQKRKGGRAISSPLDIVFSKYDVVQPDVVYFLPERAHVVKTGQVTRDRPDLVVEVLSPTTEENDRGRKQRIFAHNGVPEYWILDPVAYTLEILTLQDDLYVTTAEAGGDTVVTSPLLPDLSFPVSQLFEDC